jgi:DNA-binding NarL/FixJ family response regulator
MARLLEGNAPRESPNGAMNADLARIRLVVADDNRRVFEQLVTTLGADFDVVAYAGTGGEAVDAAIRHSPDVVVLDISMPMMSGLRAARVLREKGRPFPIVFLTVHEDEEYVRAAMEVGGLGYVLKSHLASDLVPAIRAALAGRTFVSRPYSN